MTGAVTASSQAAADAGAAILDTGGNAVDALVAAALASAVADPCNTGIGGYGGYMLVQGRGGPTRCVQFPIWLPSAIGPEALPLACPDSGPACSVVPNVVGGLARALSEFGTLPWSIVSTPAIALARDGVVANATTRRAFELHRHRPFMAECFDFEEGDASTSAHLIFRQPRLAATLARMAEQGPDWFYEGPLGSAACRAWEEAGIPIPLSDWRTQATAVEVVQAPCFEIEGLAVHAAPLGLSGSMCLFATLQAAGRIAGRGLLHEPDGLAQLASAMARVWQYRFATPNGNQVAASDVRQWVEAALSSQPDPAVCEPHTAHTAHLNAVDGAGMLAAATLTHGPAWFGGRWTLPGTGVIMNGGMHNFTRTGLVRRHGRWFGISNMTPTIADGAERGRVAVGCPGARRIPSNIALVLARYFFAGESLQGAVVAGRLHAEDSAWASFEEERLGPAVGTALQRHFAEVRREVCDNYFGPLTALRSADGGGIEAAADDRDTPGYQAWSA